MVGIVIASHSQKLAEGAVELAKMMAPEAPVVAAGGLEGGTCGTSFERIQSAVEAVDTGDGVAVLADMGSAILTTEFVIETLKDHDACLLDAPLVEGALFAAVKSQMGASLAMIQENCKCLRDFHKVAET